MPDWLVSGFSPVGLLVAILQQAPGIVWAVHPPRDDPFARNSGTPVVEVLEKTFGIASLALLVVVVAYVAVPSPIADLALVGSFLVLAAYYLLYVLYYRGMTTTSVLLGMAAFPPLAFVLVATFQGNWPAIVTSVVFGGVHVRLTYVNFALGAPAESPAD